MTRKLALLLAAVFLGTWVNGASAQSCDREIGFAEATRHAKKWMEAYANYECTNHDFLQNVFVCESGSNTYHGTAFPTSASSYTHYFDWERMLSSGSQCITRFYCNACDGSCEPNGDYPECGEGAP